MLASLSAIFVLGFPASSPQVKKPAPKPVEMHDPATLKADFNKAKGVPRVVIILSPS